jgi:hypothetical protein
MFYKNFYIKKTQRLDYVPKYIATLQGVRFTGLTLELLKAKIDRNYTMIAEMSAQAFISKLKQNNLYTEHDDYLVDNSELNQIIKSYVGENTHDYA